MNLKRPAWGRITDYVVRITGILGLIGLLVVARGQAETSRCQTRYAEKSAVSQTARAEAAAEDRAALDRMVDAVVNAKAPGDARAALLAYQTTRKAADDKRTKNPLPAPPSQFCG